MKSTIQELSPNSLSIDKDVQRLWTNTARVSKIAGKLNMSALGILTVSRRADGTMVILDGQHRCAALIEAGLGDSLVTCEVYEDLTIQQEASIFILRNTTEKVQYLDKFRVRLTEQDPVALGIKHVIDTYGWGVPGVPSGNTNINAIQALENLYLRNNRRIDGPTLASRTLEVITGAWGHNEYGVQNPAIAGVGAFVARYADVLDFKRLIERLAVYPGGPGTLLGNAKGVRNMRPNSTVNSAVAELVTDAYNHGKRSPNRLPSWFSQTDPEVDN